MRSRNERRTEMCEPAGRLSEEEIAIVNICKAEYKSASQNAYKLRKFIWAKARCNLHEGAIISDLMGIIKKLTSKETKIEHCKECGTIYGEECKCPAMETPQNDLIHRLRKRAEIRRLIPHRKSVQEGKPDRLAELLEEAAAWLEKLEGELRDV